MRLIKRLRLAASLSQPDLAKRVGVSPATVSYWEAGLCKPRARHYGPLAEALGIDAMELTKVIHPELRQTLPPSAA